jgi:hypothetical protein
MVIPIFHQIQYKFNSRSVNIFNSLHFHRFFRSFYHYFPLINSLPPYFQKCDIAKLTSTGRRSPIPLHFLQFSLSNLASSFFSISPWVIIPTRHVHQSTKNSQKWHQICTRNWHFYTNGTSNEAQRTKMAQKMAILR